MNNVEAKKKAPRPDSTTGQKDSGFDSGSDTEDETNDKENPDNAGEEGMPQSYIPFEGEPEDSHNEGKVELNEYEMRFAASLEPEGNRFDIQIKQCQAKLTELIDLNYSITKRASSKHLELVLISMKGEQAEEKVSLLVVQKALGKLNLKMEQLRRTSNRNV